MNQRDGRCHARTNINATEEVSFFSRVTALDKRARSASSVPSQPSLGAKTEIEHIRHTKLDVFTPAELVVVLVSGGGRTKWESSVVRE